MFDRIQTFEVFFLESRDYTESQEFQDENLEGLAPVFGIRLLFKRMYW